MRVDRIKLTLRDIKKAKPTLTKRNNNYNQEWKPIYISEKEMESYTKKMLSLIENFRKVFEF